MKSFSPLVDRVIASAPESSLGPGKSAPLPSELTQGTSQELSLSQQTIRDSQMARSCLSGLYLLYNQLDASHTLSQDIHTSTGSYWHGIMHRREPDADNARYWFHKMGNHPAFSLIVENLRLHTKLTNSLPEEFHPLREFWDPFLFITLCEKYRESGKDMEKYCLHLQRLEWETLFEWTWTQTFE